MRNRLRDSHNDTQSFQRLSYKVLCVLVLYTGQNPAIRALDKCSNVHRVPREHRSQTVLHPFNNPKGTWQIGNQRFNLNPKTGPPCPKEPKGWTPSGNGLRKKSKAGSMKKTDATFYWHLRPPISLPNQIVHTRNFFCVCVNTDSFVVGYCETNCMCVL